MSHEKLWENFVYNIRIIGIINRVSDPVSDGASKTCNFEYWTGRAELTVWAQCSEYLCDTDLKNQNFKRMYKFFIAFATKKFYCFLKANFSLNITPKEPKVSPITKFHNFFKCLCLICV